MLHKDGHPKGLRISNLVFTLLALIFAIVVQVLGKGSILGFLIVNSWVLLNLVFLFVGHHHLISLLKCRICLVYILFAFIAFYQILMLILLVLASGATAAANYSVSQGTTQTNPDGTPVVSTTDAEEFDDAADSLQALLWISIVYYLVNFLQGLTWVLYTSKLAHHFSHEISGGEYHKA